MTGETARSPSAWDPDTLKILEDEKIEAVERLFTSELRRIEAVIAGQERAVTLLGVANQVAQDKFEATVRDGFVKQNEFRGSLDDLGKTMATRRELEALAALVSEIRSRVDIGPADLRTLQSRVDTSGGERQGSADTWARLIAVAGAAALIGHYIH